MSVPTSSRHSQSGQSLRLQALLRRINDEIAERAAVGRTAAFVCECRDRACIDAIELPVDLYDRLRTAANCFAVRPEHVAESERVLAEGRSYAVVARADVLHAVAPLTGAA